MNHYIILWLKDMVHDKGSVKYEDHKLPSVVTRDLQHAEHDSYLAI